MLKTHIHHDFPNLIQINEANQRVYLIEGKKIKYPSVTSVLSIQSKPEIDNWIKAVGEETAERTRRRSAKRGQIFHSLIEKYLNNEEVRPSIFDIEMFNSTKKYLSRIDQIHALETRMLSHKLQVAGTVDCVAEFDQKLSIIDFKSSSQLKTADMIPGYFMQCAAYSVAFEETTGLVIDDLVIIMAVENDHALLFKESKNRWIDEFVMLREQYRQVNGI